MNIEVRDVSKRFGGFEALREISLSVPSGGLVALLGPSGSGKTTLLRVIAGLECPDAGTVLFDGRKASELQARDRGVGFVFQHYALFRHLTVAQNIAFGLTVKPRRVRPGRDRVAQRVTELLRLIQLENMADRYPAQLSGGQRQRVALARALAVDPRVLLLDEPFGALDAKVRVELRRWLRRLHDEMHITSVFVTHDQEEALEVADRVVVMNDGQIEQTGTPHEIFHQPRTEFVLRFLGQVNLFQGRADVGRVRVGSLAWEAPAVKSGHGDSVRVFVRPHELVVKRDPAESGLPARVSRVYSAGPQVRLDLTTDAGEVVSAELPHTDWQELAVPAGGRVYIRPREVKVFP